MFVIIQRGEPVYRDTYKLILKIFEYSKDFPKDYKYTLVEHGWVAQSNTNDTKKVVLNPSVNEDIAQGSAQNQRRKKQFCHWGGM